MSAAAWFCPACQKYHAPHVETCPAPVDLVGTKTMPAIQPVQITPHLRWYEPQPWEPPFTYLPVTCSITVSNDPNMIIMNGVATTGGVQ